MKTYELKPTDGRKSFYGKATVKVYEDGSETLMSYGTPIIRQDAAGNLTRIWMGWSATTGRHIKAFCGLNKKEFEALPTATIPMQEYADTPPKTHGKNTRQERLAEKKP